MAAEEERDWGRDFTHMTEGFGKDLVELAVIQADGAFESWVTWLDDDGVEHRDDPQINSDAVWCALDDMGLPTEGGW